MNFKISSEELLNTLTIVSKALPQKTPLPILYTIKIDAYENYLLFTATNSDIAIEVSVNKNINVKNTGSFCISGKYLIEIIKKIDQGEVEFLQVDESNVVIKTQKSSFKLKVWDSSEFVDINYVVQKDEINIPNETFKEILDQTLYAVSTDDKKTLLKGVQFLSKDNVLSICATDAYRLSRKVIEIDTNKEFDIIIPGQSLKELLKIIETTESDIKLYISDYNNKALFILDNIAFQTRLIEGVYPDISKLIIDNFNLEIPFNKNELLIASDRISILSTKEKNDNTYINLTLRKDNIVEISSRNEEIGAAQELIYVYGSVKGDVENFRITFNSKYLIEALKTYNSSEVVIKFTDETKQFCIYGEEDLDLLAIILPVKLNQ